MDAQIITIGNELLLGRTEDSNATWLSRRLDEAGFNVSRRVTVGDNIDEIEEAIRHALFDATVVIATGGLGPTHDDITRKAVARVFGAELKVDPVLEKKLVDLYKRRGRPVNDQIRSMALVPDGFEWMSNPIGTAPGLVMKMTAFGRRCLLVFPGVPYEMRAMFREHANGIFEYVARLASSHRTFRTAGITETRLQEILSPALSELPDQVSAAFLPDPRNGVALRLTARSASADDAQEALESVSVRIQPLIKKYVYGGEEDRLEAVVGAILTAQGRTLSIAESCTGGLIGDRITDVPGSSAYLKGCVVTYSNEAKMDLLGVKRKTLRSEGAVSKLAAQQMAAGCRARFGTDIAISVTGIAGPDGGTEEKPVGTAWIGIADSDATMAFHLKLTENRRLNKELASTGALNLLRRRLIETTGYEIQE
jgi:nicotinamide-nucleotide amidase